MKISILVICCLCLTPLHVACDENEIFRQIEERLTTGRKLALFSNAEVSKLIFIGQQVARGPAASPESNPLSTPVQQNNPASVQDSNNNPVPGQDTSNNNPASVPSTTQTVVSSSTQMIPEAVTVEQNNGECRSIVEIVSGVAQLTTFLNLIKTVQLDQELNKLFIGTVFAPTNAAFEQLARERGITVQQFTESSQKNLIETMLALHVVPTLALDTEDFSDGQDLPTFLAGPETLQLLKEDSWKVTSRRPSTGSLVGSNLFSCYGVVHVINNVLMPTVATLP